MSGGRAGCGGQLASASSRAACAKSRSYLFETSSRSPSFGKPTPAPTTRTGSCSGGPMPPAEGPAAAAQQTGGTPNPSRSKRFNPPLQPQMLAMFTRRIWSIFNHRVRLSTSSCSGPAAASAAQSGTLSPGPTRRTKSAPKRCTSPASPTINSTSEPSAASSLAA